MALDFSNLDDETLAALQQLAQNGAMPTTVSDPMPEPATPRTLEPAAEPALPLPPPVPAQPQPPPQPVAQPAENADDTLARLRLAQKHLGQSAYAKMIAGAETGGMPDPMNAKNPLSTAGGQNQILDGTMTDTLKNHPELAGSDKNDPRVLEALRQDNAAVLRKELGHDPTPMEELAAHRLGATGAVRFLQAVYTAPETTTDKVMSPEVLKANAKVYLNPDGSPKTVGEVYAHVAQQTQNGTVIPQQAQAAPAPQAAPTRSSLFPSTESVYGQQGADIQKYIQSQPAMWAKLQAMQDEYKRSGGLTQMDRVEDAFNNFAQLHSIADANKHASAGGVLLNANPNADNFVKALQGTHQSDLQQREVRLNQAKTAYDLGSSALQAQNSQEGQNLGLTGQLAGEKAKYGYETSKENAAHDLAISTKLLELKKFEQSQTEAQVKAVHEIVPNPDTAAWINGELAKIVTPGESLSSVIPKINALAEQARKAGMEMAAKEPVHMFAIVKYDDNKNEISRNFVNGATKEGQQAIKDASSNSTNRVLDLASPQVNIDNTKHEAGSSEKGSPVADLLAASQMKANVQGAKVLIKMIQDAGGNTGPLTSDKYIILANAFKQLGISESPTGAPRVLLGKILKDIQVKNSMLALGGMARIAQGEFMQAAKTSVDGDAPIEAISTYLDHQGAMADWQLGHADHLLKEGQKARESNNTYYSHENASRDYLLGNEKRGIAAHPYPTWNMDEAAPRKDAAPEEPIGTTKLINGKNYIKTPEGWKTQ